MKNLKVRAFLHILLNIFIIIGVLFGVTYAWYSTFFDLTRIEHKPGDLNSSFSFAKYNKDTAVWESVNLGEDLEIGLGEMRNIANLPPNNEHYFKFKLMDTSTAITHYNVIIEKINIIVESTAGTFDLDGVDYYITNPSQNAFNFYFHMSTINDIDPTVIFEDYENMAMNKVTAPNEGIFPDYVELENWTYVMIKPQLREVQNIIRQVPVEYSPYTLVFNMDFAGEVRTIDE